MTENKMSDFFDKLAPTWDQNELHSKYEIESFLNVLPIKKDDKILDVGCGTGLITPILYKKSEGIVKGIDISKEMIKIALNKKIKNVSFICEDFNNFKETDYDFIVIFNAYPHFLDLEKFKKSLVRTLKENGKFAIIHNFSRQELIDMHQGSSLPLTRDLKPAKEEAAFYKDKFNILETKETTHSFYILCQKK
jgi:ubiquinone/menaquinone biosynthesis C-methylase UbiE